MIACGCDIASYQGTPDFAKLRAEGCTFSITKVTGEGNYTNPYWHDNTVAARAAGIVTGFYDWCEPQGWATDADGVAAADDYIRVITPALQPGDLICVDYETPIWNTGPLGTGIESAFKAYLYRLRDALQTPIIVYSGPYFLVETGAQHWDWLGRDFLYWMAAPGAGMLPDDAPWPGPQGVGPWSVVTCHQHQWYATSDAVVGQFDRDRFDGDVAALAAFGIPNHDLGKDEKTPIADLIAANVTVPGQEAGMVREPAEGKYTAYVNDAGQTIFVWNAGGQAVQVDGIAVVDLGVSVVNKDGEKFDRSIQGDAVQVWHDRKAA